MHRIRFYVATVRDGVNKGHVVAPTPEEARRLDRELVLRSVANYYGAGTVYEALGAEMDGKPERTIVAEVFTETLAHPEVLARRLGLYFNQRSVLYTVENVDVTLTECLTCSPLTARGRKRN